MKKFMFTFVLSALLLCNYATAQTYEKGTSVLNLGVGLGGFNGPSFSASFEVGFFPIGEFGVIGLGGFAGFRSYNLGITTTDASYNEISFGPRGTFHFITIPVEKLDVYAALQILVRHQSVNYKDNFFEDTSTFIRPFTSAVAGARYYLKDKLAVFAELGYGLSYLTAGASLKF